MSNSCALSAYARRRLALALDSPLRMKSTFLLPPVSLQPLAFLRSMVSKVSERDLVIHFIRVEGKAAADCVAESFAPAEHLLDPIPKHKDLNMTVYFSSQNSLPKRLSGLTREIMYECLWDSFLPALRAQLSDEPEHAVFSYVHHLALSELSNLGGEDWDQFTFAEDADGTTFSIKFVLSSLRPYCFSVDSFYVEISHLLQASQFAITASSLPDAQDPTTGQDLTASVSNHVSNGGDNNDTTSLVKGALSTLEASFKVPAHSSPEASLSPVAWVASLAPTASKSPLTTENKSAFEEIQLAATRLTTGLTSIDAALLTIAPNLGVQSLSALENLLQLARAGSYFGTISSAVEHLFQRVLAVHSPQDTAHMYGGGLFEYTKHLCEGYVYTDYLSQYVLEQAMCNRFARDFPPFTVSTHSHLSMQVHSLNDFLCANYPLSRSAATTVDAFESLNFMQALLDIVRRTGALHSLVDLDAMLTSALNAHGNAAAVHARHLAQAAKVQLQANSSPYISRSSSRASVFTPAPTPPPRIRTPAPPSATAALRLVAPVAVRAKLVFDAVEVVVAVPKQSQPRDPPESSATSHISSITVVEASAPVSDSENDSENDSESESGSSTADTVVMNDSPDDDGFHGGDDVSTDCESIADDAKRLQQEPVVPRCEEPVICITEDEVEEAEECSVPQSPTGATAGCVAKVSSLGPRQGVEAPSASPGRPSSLLIELYNDALVQTTNLAAHDKAAAAATAALLSEDVDEKSIAPHLSLLSELSVQKDIAAEDPSVLSQCRSSGCFTAEPVDSRPSTDLRDGKADVKSDIESNQSAAAASTATAATAASATAASTTAASASASIATASATPAATAGANLVAGKVQMRSERGHNRTKAFSMSRKKTQSLGAPARTVEPNLVTKPLATNIEPPAESAVTPPQGRSGKASPWAQMAVSAAVVAMAAVSAVLVMASCNGAPADAADAGGLSTGVWV